MHHHTTMRALLLHAVVRCRKRQYLGLQAGWRGWLCGHGVFDLIEACEAGGAVAAQQRYCLHAPGARRGWQQGRGEAAGSRAATLPWVAAAAGLGDTRRLYAAPGLGVCAPRLPLRRCVGPPVAPWQEPAATVHASKRAHAVRAAAAGQSAPECLQSIELCRAAGAGTCRLGRAALHGPRASATGHGAHERMYSL